MLLRHPLTEKRMSLENDAFQRRFYRLGKTLCIVQVLGKWKRTNIWPCQWLLLHITGSSQLGTLLNRLGHSVSDSWISELDMAVAEDQLRQHNLSAVFIPSNIACQGHTLNTLLEQQRHIRINTYRARHYACNKWHCCAMLRCFYST